MVEKTFYFIRETFKNGNTLFFGKEDKMLPLGDIHQSWYVKEYGFETIEEARKGIRRLKYQNKRLGYDPNESKIDIASTVLIFDDADALKFMIVKKERFEC